MSKSPSLQDVVAAADRALDRVAGAELDLDDVASAMELARAVDRLDRKVRSLEVRVIDAIGAGKLHEPDGHASPRVMVAHANRLSEAEAMRRDRVTRMVAEMSAVRVGLASGRIGRCQADRLARVYVNPRVQAEFVKIDEQVARLAAMLTYEELDRRLTNWVRQVDEEGTADRARRAHENRRARLVQDFDGGWELLCLIGGLTGAQMHAIFRAFVEAEFQADWAEAREVHGDATTVAHLARTFDQRDADAVARIFEFAANAFAAAPGGAPIDTTIVMDHETFEREARRAAGAKVEPRPAPDLGPLPFDGDPGEPSDPGGFADASDAGADGSSASGPAADGASADPSDAAAAEHIAAGTGTKAAESTGPDVGEGGDRPHPGREFRCETLDGHPIDPTEAFANALVGRVRRAVVGWDGVVLDMSGRHQLFTRALRQAVLLAALTCYWPGCKVKHRHCQIDHLDPRRNGGRTNPHNGGPACGRHNRLKEHGYTARMDERGRMHVYRPDGTEID